MIANAAGELTAPLINKSAIRADYLTANARQLQAIYDYQRTVLNAFTEVVNSMAKVQNYRRSVQIKQEQVKPSKSRSKSPAACSTCRSTKSLPGSSTSMCCWPLRDLLEARTVLIETKQQQLTAIVRAYQALGGGYLLTNSGPEMADVLCGPPGMIWETPAREVIPTPAPANAAEQPGPGGENLPAPPKPDADE